MQSRSYFGPKRINLKFKCLLLFPQGTCILLPFGLCYLASFRQVRCPSTRLEHGVVTHNKHLITLISAYNFFVARQVLSLYSFRLFIVWSSSNIYELIKYMFYTLLSATAMAEPSQRPTTKNVCKTRGCNYSF